MTNDSQHVVQAPGTDKHHKSHPSGLLRQACDPTKRGHLTREDNLDTDRCQHQACFGGDNDE